VVLEALANSVPVVCTPVGELPAMLKDGVDALFVPAGDPAALGTTLAKAIEDRPLREWLAVNGRALYERQFSMRHFFCAIARIHRRHFGVAGQLPEPAAMQEQPR
jgi:glycosyltransferase involved in cell wall biosynthesis